MTCMTALLAAVGCGDGTGPGELPRHFELTRVDGAPLPAVLSSGALVTPAPDGSDVTCDYKLRSMQIVFGDDKRFTATSERFLVCDDGRPDVSTTIREMGHYTVSGDTISTDVESGFPPGLGPLARHISYAIREGRVLRMFRQDLSSGYGEYQYEDRVFLFVAVP